MTDRKIAPGRRVLLPVPVGILAEYPRNPIGCLTDMVRQFGDVFRAQVGTAVIHLIIHPNDVQRVFQDRVENYPRSWLYYVFDIGVGKGMVATKGEVWRQQRVTSDPRSPRPTSPASRPWPPRRPRRCCSAGKWPRADGR